MLNFPGKANTLIHGLVEDDTAKHFLFTVQVCVVQSFLTQNAQSNRPWLIVACALPAMAASHQTSDMVMVTLIYLFSLFINVLLIK